MPVGQGGKALPVQIGEVFSKPEHPLKNGSAFPAATSGMNYALVTLGCKLNQYDSAALAGRLEASGFSPSGPDSAHLVFLNTCTVTHRADRDARKALRSLRRSNPRALLAVFGCSVRLEPEVYRAMPEADAVLEDAQAIDRFLQERGIQCASVAALPRFGDRTRALLKIQEGCDFPCTYCIVPRVRGVSRSVPPESVELEFRSLLFAGHKEIVLTGINTGEYGKDMDYPGGLGRLLERLLKVDGEYRIRLNSVEPRAVTAGLVSLLKSESRLAPHLQIPLQSGSDTVLKAMRRNYRTHFYEELLLRLADEIPGIGLGADVLAGFPTETGEDFEATRSLVGRLPLAYLHAFSYSPRPGTPASCLKPLDPRLVRERTTILIGVGRDKKARFASSFEGRSLDALTLAGESGRGRALAGNFLDVVLQRPHPPNRFVKVRIDGVRNGAVLGSVLEA